MKIGKTGTFPEGKISEHDEGALVIAVGIDQGNVIIHFGEKVAWVGMNAEGAEQFANNILDKVKKLRGSYS